MRLIFVTEQPSVPQQKNLTFKSELDDLLDELERCCASQHFEVADDVRAKIHKLIEDKWYNENFSEFQRNANIRLKKDEAHEDGTLTIIYRILESASGEFRSKYIRYLTTDKCDIKYERFKQDMESCERSLISTIEFWQPAVDGKSAVEKVKAYIRAERGV